MGLFALKNNLNLKWRLKFITVATGAGIEAISAPPTNMGESFTWHVSVSCNHPTSESTLSLVWYADKKLSELLWTDFIQVPAASDPVVARGPCRSPWLVVIFNVPRQAAAFTTMDANLDGTNEILDIAQQYRFSNPPVLPLSAIPVVADHHDNRRTQVSWNGFDVLGVAAEALLSLNRDDNFGAPVAASNYTVPNGKSLRIVSITLVTRNSQVAGTSSNLLIRLRTGATTAGNEILQIHGRTLNESGPVVTPITIPDGFEIPSGQQFCFTHINGGNITRFDLLIIAKLYEQCMT